jgi:hypothetical protein
MTVNGWIGVDLDGTLALYNGWQGAGHIGEPVPLMVERVRAWRAQGIDVRIFTARISDEREPNALTAIQRWCHEHLGEVLPVTNVKDFGMVELWDDRAVTVEKNSGKVICATPPLGWTP